MSLRGRITAGAVIVLLAAAALPAIVEAGGPVRPAATPPATNVVVDPSQVVARLPRSFLGLSTEYWDLPVLDSRPGLLARAFALLHVPGDGPMLLRIGGDSADHTLWRRWMDNERFPTYTVGRGWFTELRALTLRARLKLMLDLNLAAGSPRMAGAFARTARASLPAHSLVAFSVGNEPDVYHRELNYRWALRGATRAWWRRYSAARYARAFGTYAAALRQTGIPLAGPEAANPRRDLEWLRRLIAVDGRRVGMLTAHRYPLSACAAPGSSRYPTIAKLLSARVAAEPAQTLTQALELARSSGLPLRVTELGSVTCGGVDGISDTFATALWTPDALFGLLRAGVAGVNVHVRPDAFNAAFSVGSQGLIARPLMYGLIAFARMLGPGAELVRTTLLQPKRSDLSAWSVRLAGGQLHVLVLDKGSRPARVALHLPARGAAAVARLLAPSAQATSGVTWGGRWLGPDGRWHGARRLERLAPSRFGYVLTLPAYSGAILSVQGSAVVPVVVPLDHYRVAHVRLRRAPTRLRTARSGRPARRARPAARSARRTSAPAHGRERRSRRDRPRSR